MVGCVDVDLPREKEAADVEMSFQSGFVQSGLSGRRSKQDVSSHVSAADSDRVQVAD